MLEEIVILVIHLLKAQNLMKYLQIILLLILIGCQSENKNDRNALSQAEQHEIAAFENAQIANDTLLAINILASSVNNPILLNSLIETANYGNIIRFLVQQGFLLKHQKGNDYNFQSLCSYNHVNIICIINRINNIQMHDKELQSALKIAGCNLCNTMQRDSFITIEILVNKEFASDELNFISNLLKLRSDNIEFQSAFSSILQLADKKTVLMFLKKSGYLEFNSRSDEYTNFHPEKLSHLTKSAKDAVFKKAEMKLRE